MQDAADRQRAGVALMDVIDDESAEQEEQVAA
jgi:hypothetical protein